MDGDPAFTVHAFRAVIKLKCMYVTTTDLMFRKSFDLWSFDKLDVEMDL